ncbi:MAG TPA: hypothetical protein VIU61_24105 [Kofleriaceae bacterium]
MLGLLPARMTFSGVYRYPSASDLEAAVAEVSELLDAEDDEALASGFDQALRRRGIELRIELDCECPRDWYLAYETLVELLAARASSGLVDGSVDDTAHSYPAGARTVRLATEPLVPSYGSTR